MYRLIVLSTVALFLGTLFAAPNADEKPENSENSILLDDDDQRIINGTKAAPGEYTFMCSIQTHNEHGYSKFCGGSLIQRKWVLTAAHCLLDYRNGEDVGELRVVCGSTHSFQYLFDPKNSTAQIIKVYKVYVHQKFSGVGSGHDIALLELAKSVEPNQWVQPIAMASPKYNPVGKMGKNMGWGAIHPVDISNSTYELMVGPGYVLDPQECMDKHGWRPFDHEICIFHNESSGCAGDSGGPHIHTLDNGQVVQVGIVSYGDAHNCSSRAAVFTKVSSFLPWIRDVFRGNFHKYDLPK